MILTAEHKVRVRFSEVDSMGVVWHGSYVNFLEDAREEFGRKYNMGYMDVYRNGFFIPLVKVDIDYKKWARYEDVLIVKISLENTFSAKMIFNYEIINEKTNDVIVKAKTIQVFTSTEGELMLYLPEFYSDWKQKHNLNS